MGAVISLTDFRRARRSPARPAPEPPPVFLHVQAAAHLFALSVYLALTPATMGGLLPEHADEWRADAVAALKAMREPSPVMIEAGWNSGSGAQATYTSMIDHEIKLAEGGRDGEGL